MSFVKDLFWDEDECVVQFHPPRSEYVNNHASCLHLWRNKHQQFPLPPSILVGDKAAAYSALKRRLKLEVNIMTAIAARTIHHRRRYRRSTDIYIIAHESSSSIMVTLAKIAAKIHEQRSNSASPSLIPRPSEWRRRTPSVLALSGGEGL